VVSEELESLQVNFSSDFEPVQNVPPPFDDDISGWIGRRSKDRR
jgi:hypothetical protein